jgi:glutathione S-transferase
MGMPPSEQRAIFGGNYFSCPSIQYFPADGSAPILVTDTWGIAAFLEERHPTPPAFPKQLSKASLQEQTKFSRQLWDEFQGPIFPVLIRGSYFAINEVSKPYFRETREKMVGMKIEEMCPTKEDVNRVLATAKGNLDRFMKNFPGDGPFLYGEEVTYLDMALMSIFAWMKCIAEEELWMPAKEWDGGRWKRVLDIFEERGYCVVRE